MALDFPSLAEIPNQNPENTYSPTSTPKSTDNGLTYIWNGNSWDLKLSENLDGGGDHYTDADVDKHLNKVSATDDSLLSWSGTDYSWVSSDNFLSAVNDDTAAGAITFESKTTHEAGISVTSGQLRVDTAGTGQSIRANLSGAKSTDSYTAFFASTLDGSSVTGGEVIGYTASNNITQATGAAEIRGFSSNIDIAGSPVPDATYNFYAQGNAPNFFSGAMLYGSVNTSMENDAGTEDGWVFSPVGRASSHCTLSAANDNNASLTMWKHDSRTGKFISFKYSNRIGNGGTDECGSVRQLSANSVDFVSTSDNRVKENIVDLPNATERVKEIKTYQYNFKNEPDVIHEGFVAHELQEHTVLTVTGEKDATEVFGTYTDVDGNVETDVPEPATIPAGATFEPQGTRDVYQGVASSALIPLLTKALQEALDKIENLEDRLSDAGIA